MSYYCDQFLSSQPRKASGNPFVVILLTAVLLGLASWAAYAWRVAPTPLALEEAGKAVVCIAVQGEGDVFGTGSGAVINPKGFIVTNKHVVEGAGPRPKIQVVFNSGTDQAYAVEASVEAVDTHNLDGNDGLKLNNYHHDWAVLRVEATDLPYLAIGSSSAMKQGDTVVAAGFPFGNLEYQGDKGPPVKIEKGSMTRLVRGDEGKQVMVLVHNCQLAPGHSGGPLLNEHGELVGINTSIGTLGTSQGLGNAGENQTIPADLLQELVWSRFAKTVNSSESAK